MSSFDSFFKSKMFINLKDIVTTGERRMSFRLLGCSSDGHGGQIPPVFEVPGHFLMPPGLTSKEQRGKQSDCDTDHCPI